MIASGRQTLDIVAIPDEYALHQNYPNPFNPSTRINYEIPKTSKVSLKIYDVLGREVSTLIDGVKIAGIYQIIFNFFFIFEIIFYII